MDKTITDQGTLLMDQLNTILENARNFRELVGDGTYQAFLHGQAAGLVLALKIMFPGDGNLGEQASALVVPVLGENKCGCHHHDEDEDSSGE